MPIETTINVTGRLVTLCSLPILIMLRNVRAWYGCGRTISGWPSPPRRIEEDVRPWPGRFRTATTRSFTYNWKTNTCAAVHCIETRRCAQGFGIFGPKHQVTACLTRRNVLPEVRPEFPWKGTLTACQSTPKRERKRRLTDKSCRTGTRATSHVKLKKIGKSDKERRTACRDNKTRDIASCTKRLA